MNSDEIKEAVDNMLSKQEAIEGTLDSFDTLIHNHMTEYKTAFGRLRQQVSDFMANVKETNELRDRALHAKIDGYKWGLILVASFTVISLGGFVALALWALSGMPTW